MIMRFAAVILSLFLFSQSVYALDIVYPKSQDVTINSPTTFFVGSADTTIPLKVNGKTVSVHKSGGFAYFVNLNFGENNFTIESGDQKQNFTIVRPKLQSSSTIQKPEINYETPMIVSTAKDNIPLRSTPVDDGINRIAHLQEGIPLTVAGEKNGFYKIRLNGSQNAWISIKDVSPCEGLQPVHLLSRTSVEDDKYYIFKIEFDQKTVYQIEESPFSVKFYNVADKPDSTFIFTFPLPQRLAGYSGYFEGNTFILKIRKFPDIDKKRPLKNLKIVIDAGHGGNENGATGCLGDKEKDINLKIARNLAHELRLHGAKVVMTRNGDESAGLQERVDITNKNDGMIFISIHGNAVPDSLNPNENSGTSIYYYYPQAKPLADAVLKSMVSGLPFKDDKVRQRSFAVVRNTNALSILIEVGYLINPSDNSYLIDEEIQKQTAKQIAAGIEKFLKD